MKYIFNDDQKANLADSIPDILLSNNIKLKKVMFLILIGLLLEM